MLIHPTQFHGVVGVDHHHHITELSAHLLNHGLLGVGQLQVVLPLVKVIVVAVVGVAGVIVIVVGIAVCHVIPHIIGIMNDGVHIVRFVLALTAGTGNHNDRFVGKFLCLVHQRISVFLNGRLGEGPVRAGHAGASQVANGAVFHIQIDKALIDGKSCIL